jgi:hypothetical protein
LIEVINHLAFYSGWPNSMSAIMIAKELFLGKDTSSHLEVNGRQLLTELTGETSNNEV